MVMKLLQMVITKVNLKIIKDTDKDNMFGKTVKAIQVNGAMGLKVDLVFGNLVKVIVMLVNGWMVKSKDMECIIMLQGKDIKDNISNF